PQTWGFCSYLKLPTVRAPQVPPRASGSYFVLSTLDCSSHSQIRVNVIVPLAGRTYPTTSLAWISPFVAANTVLSAGNFTNPGSAADGAKTVYATGAASLAVSRSVIRPHDTGATSACGERLSNVTV